MDCFPGGQTLSVFTWVASYLGDPRTKLKVPSLNG